MTIPEIEFSAEIFNDIYLPYFNNKSRYLHLWGSSGSGKSVFAAQKKLIRTLREPNNRFLIVRNTFNSHRQSTFKLFKKLIYDYNLNDFFRFSEARTPTILDISCINNNELIFVGCDDVERLKSIVDITGSWFEEPTELSREDFIQIDLRIRGKSKNYKQNILTYNPVDEFHWIRTTYHDKEDSSHNFLHTTYHNNKFIDVEFKRVLEDLKNVDETTYTIYGLGEWATAKELIFPNWKQIPLTQYPSKFQDECYGVDFGYNNPTALTHIGFAGGRRIYIRQLLYETHLITSDFIKLMNEMDISKRIPMYSDIEPDRIEEIRRAGYNCHPADKSVKEGIDFLKSFDVYYTDDSPELHKERCAYKWKTDRRTGAVLDEPVKFMDHAIDSVRYPVYTHGKKYWSSNVVPVVNIKNFNSGSRFTMKSQMAGY